MSCYPILSCPNSAKQTDCYIPIFTHPVTPFLSICITLDDTCILVVKLPTGRSLWSHHTPTADCHTVKSLCGGLIEPPRSLLQIGHSLHPFTPRPNSRIVAIVWLCRTAWYQLGPVREHTLGLLSPSPMTKE
ncbi:hypothetical protein ATANTOWER_007960 [Ataeniobius toweri]|uniref:Uncharacterized protein n=1 Tax=Ataeniobius toweri TaxID=208326 RepID=A0ABU7C6X2_9TELE|nr:hypothetical protein [Ataeniobius toweri]